MKKEQWYSYSQNNSGGYFVQDEYQGPLVFIQAASAKDAWSQAQEMFDFSYCDCCGARWYERFEGTDEPMVYGTPLADAPKSYLRDYVILHHIDGRVERVELKERAN